MPRWLNRYGSYILLKAAELGAPLIDEATLQAGLVYARDQLRGQAGLTSEDYYLLEIVLEKGTISDDSITLDELERLKAETFNEILPRLDKLVEFDLIKRMPTERATEYAPVPLLEAEPGDRER